MKNHVSLSTLRVTLLLSIVLILHSCGSFQPTSQYATDGIYGSDQNSVKVSPSEVVALVLAEHKQEVDQNLR